VLTLGRAVCLLPCGTECSRGFSDRELGTMNTHLGTLSPQQSVLRALDSEYSHAILLALTGYSERTLDHEYSFTFGTRAAQIGTVSTHIEYSHGHERDTVSACTSHKPLFRMSALMCTSATHVHWLGVPPGTVSHRVGML
jgi:hypothetical protein